jgi:serralysin
MQGRVEVADLSFWEQQIAIGSDGPRRKLQLVALKDGTFVAVWEQQVGGDSDIVAQVYYADGTAKSGVIQVNTLDTRDNGTASSQVTPVVTALASGGFAVAWTDFSNSTQQGANVRGRTFDANGVGNGDDFLASISAEGNQYLPEIAAYGNGFVVSAVEYSSDSPEQQSLITTLLDPTGKVLRSYRIEEISVSHSVASIGKVPEGESRYGGMFIVATLRDKGASLTDTIQLRAYNDESDVAEHISPIEVGLYAKYVSITALANGRFVVVWQEAQGTDPRNYLIKAATYEADGGPSGIETLVETQDEIKTPVVAALPNGGFALAYAIDGDIQARTYDRNGEHPRSAVYVHADRAGEQSAPTITVLPDGRFIVGWTDTSVPTAPTTHAQIMDNRDAQNWTGTNAGEQFWGTVFGDTLKGLGGDDKLFGHKGDDWLTGGEGQDTLDGGEGRDWAWYEGSTQGLVLSIDPTRVLPQGQVRVADTYVSIEVLSGTAHDDKMYTSHNGDGLFGRAGHDLLVGGNGNDYLNGGEGNDTVRGGDGNDEFVGFDGDDHFWGDKGDDIFDGGEGKDWVWYGDYKPIDPNSRQGLILSLNNKTDGKNSGEIAEGDTYFSIEALSGSDYDDEIYGNDAGNDLRGRFGADLLVGGRGHDWLDAGQDNDTVEGGEGNDTLNGGAGNDTLNGGAGNDTLDGGSGLNTAVFSGNRDEYTITRTRDGSLTVAYRDGTDTDTLKGIKQLQFNDTAEFLNTAPTGLQLAGSSIQENAPTRAVVGTLSATDLDGDRLTYTLLPGSSSAFTIDPTSNSLVVTGPLDFETQPNHQVTIQADDGFGGKTTLTVNVTVTNAIETTPFTIRGTPRADVLTGENGNDTIYGSGANDALSGLGGDDRIHGGAGKDQLTGGAGKDVFVFDTRLNKRTNVDKISDFRYQDDSIYLENRYLTKLGSGTASKPKKFKSDMFVQNTKAQDAEDRIVYDKRTGKLYYDEDGTGAKAQILIATLTNKATLKYHDFFVI